MNDKLSSRQKRLQFLARKNHREVILDRYIDALSKQLNCPLTRDHAIDLEQSEKLSQEFFNFLQNPEQIFSKEYSSSDIPDGVSIVQKIGSHIPPQKYYLITDYGEDILERNPPFNIGHNEVGIFFFPCQTLLKNFNIALLKTNTDHKIACGMIGIYDKETCSGIYIDYSEGCGTNVDCCNPEYLEIKVFGEEWRKYI